MQKVQARSLDHDNGLAQGNKGIGRTGQSNDAEPAAALPKCWTVNEQNRAARERQNCYKRQQNPEHPLSESSVSRCRNFVIACGSHAGYNRREDRVKGLINFSEAVGGADNCTVNTNCRKCHAGRPSDEVTECDEIQPSNKCVN